MLGGLYGDLPPPSSAEEDRTSNSVWSSSAKMAPSTLRKTAAPFAPPQSILKTKSPLPPPQIKTLVSSAPDVGVPKSTPSFQAALVGVTATVIDEYDPARPNDYEEYRKEKKRRAAEAEMKRELERRRREEEEREREREQREREREEKDYHSSKLNISGEEAWKRRAAMSGVPPRSPSPPPSAEGFMIGKSGSAGLGVGAGGQMTAAQRMMAKMGWKEGQGLGKQEQGISTPLMARRPTGEPG